MYGVDMGAKEEDVVEGARIFTLTHHEEVQHTVGLHRLAAGPPWGNSNMVEEARTHKEAWVNLAVAWHLNTSHLCFAALPDPRHQLPALYSSLTLTEIIPLLVIPHSLPHLSLTTYIRRE